MAKSKLLLITAGVISLLFACNNPATTTTTSSTTSTPRPTTTPTPTTEKLTDINDFVFVLNDEGTYSVKAYDTFEPSTVVVPSEYEGIKVTHILDNAFSGKTSGIQKIVLSENIKYCSALSFNESFTLEAIEINENNPNYCSLGGIVYSKDQSELVFAPRNIEEAILPENTKIICDMAFKNSRVQRVTLNQGLETIGNNVFENTPKLESVNIPNSVTSLGEELFSLSGVKNITIGTGVSKVPYHFVNNCDELRSITIPGNVKTIEMLAFYESQNLFNVTLEEGVETIEYGGFANCGTSNLSLPSSLRSIGSEAFTRNMYLENVVIPEGVETLGDGVFWGCGYLKTLSLPSTLKEIGVSVVAYANNLTSISVAKGNQYFKVDNNVLFSYDMTRLLAFPGNHADFSYVIPTSVTTIDREAFSGVKRLDDLTIPTSVTTIGAYCFRETNRLTSVKYLGTVIDWAKVSKSEVYLQLNDNGTYQEVDVYWSDLSSIKEVVCSDRTIPVVNI